MGNVDLINCRSLAKYTRLFGMPDSIVQAYNKDNIYLRNYIISYIKARDEFMDFLSRYKLQ